MKSTIDWNEIVPLLPRSKREDLMLEAVSILSEGHVTKRRVPGVHPPTSSQYTKRYWKDSPEGHGAQLAQAGRHYRLNKLVLNGFRQDGKIGKLWKLLVESKNDHITYEGLASLAKGQKLAASAAVSHLWSQGYIDVIEAKKFAEAI
jgi:hypothetical protein